MAERDHAALIRIPKRQTEGPPCIGDGKTVGIHKLRMIPKDFWNPIEWNAADQMMDVVGADVCRKPAQHGRKVQVRAALQGSVVERPAIARIPMRMFELVLN